MRYLTISGCFIVLLACPLPAANLPVQRTQEITPAPVGPFHVVGNRVVDSKGRPFLMRGTQLTEFRPQTVIRDNRAARISVRIRQLPSPPSGFAST
jgi:hypothetical protein